jgi:hypothetical protein
VLDGYGGVHRFAGGAAALPPQVSVSAYWGWDIARSLTLATSTTGYVLDGYGGIHPFAPAGVTGPPTPSSPGYSPGWDTFDGIAFDRKSKTGVDVTAAYVDGSGDTLYGF